MNRKSILPVALAIIFLLQACNFPADLIPPTPGLPPTATATATAIPSETPLPTLAPSATFTPVPALEVPTLAPTATLTPLPTETPLPIDFPTVVFNTNANCRQGPSRTYFSRTSFLTARSTVAEGRNQDGSWLWVKATGGHCWVNVSTIKDPISFTFLPIVDFPPLPESPNQLLAVHQDCAGSISITLRWSNTTGETGYNLYRNGIMLTTLKADAVEYTDYPGRSSSYLYEIEAMNDYGVSERFMQTIAGCK